MTARRACVGALGSASLFAGYHFLPESTNSKHDKPLSSFFASAESRCAPSNTSGSQAGAVGAQSTQGGPQGGTDTPTRSCVVVGGGIIGLTTAYFLAKDGVKVTVIEGKAGPVEGTSKGNAGALRRFALDPVVGRASIPAMIRAFIGMPGYGHLLFNPRVLLEWDFIRWGANFLVGACLNDPCDMRNVTEKLVDLSHKQFDVILQHENIAAHEIDLCEGGCIRLFSDQKQFRNAISALHLCESSSVHKKNPTQQQPSSEKEPVQEEEEPASPSNVVVLRGMSQIVKLEPRLQGMPGIVGALYQPADRTANCPKFGALLAEKLVTNYGVRFIYNETVVACTRDSGSGDNRVVELTTNKGTIVPVTDTLVVCCGHNSAAIAKQNGDMLPVIPMRGYSVTFNGSINQQHIQEKDNQKFGKDNGDISNDQSDLQSKSLPHPKEDSVNFPRDDSGNVYIKHNQPPLSHLVVHPKHIYLTPFGNDVRVTAFAEFAPRNAKPNAYAIENLPIFGRKLFPNAVPPTSTAPKVWMGNRPQTPDDLPIISKSANTPNVFYNTGHGSRGWVLAAGSGYVLSELMGRSCNGYVNNSECNGRIGSNGYVRCSGGRDSDGGDGEHLDGLGQKELDALSVERFWL